ncbi:hypothetical protein Aph01nite_10500 [Acrocarpospora phusangensis]|uniref:Uncharacterized protein n=1 Tax=Acrocarpospora phusangensis TaxID=1070424 RepID=A0A919Q8Q3_9ACTN|nr:hypothetical protein [Acrocarpospora phusangensis]GIH22740.1 hypothetical protein Aph01nite_10500 [Acrocarpospora phusangensis]
MRRYRFGIPALLIAVLYAAVVGAFGVIALVTGDSAPVVRIVFREDFDEPDDEAWGLIVGLILVGCVQGWALWQILRGRVTGQGEPAPRDRAVRWLRVTLYLWVGLNLVQLLPIRLPWWTDAVDGLILLALAPLFFRVLNRAPRVLRITALVAGLITGISWVGTVVADEIDAHVAEEVFEFAGASGIPWPLWLVLTLVAQARDGRWGRTTIWAGAVRTASPYVLTPWLFALGSSYSLLIVSAVVGPLLIVWQARSAHDLASPPARLPSARPVPVRAPARWWPLAAAAVALPLLPALPALVRGRPVWLGPEGPIEYVLSSGPQTAMLWAAVNVFVGAGGLAVLVLVAVVRRTRRLVRTTTAALALAAASGVAHVTATEVAGYTFDPMFSLTLTGEAGVSPLWSSAAFAASAILLRLLYGGPPRRTRLHLATAAIAPVGGLLFLPVGDQWRGGTTAQEDCFRGARSTFLCQVRTTDVLTSVKHDPDRYVLAYGERLCGVYTRNDPHELARVQRTDGVRVADLEYTLADICPRAAAIVTAAAAEEEREMLALEAAERRKCREAPRHRPPIEPVQVVAQREPMFTDYGQLMAYEEEIAEHDPYDGALPFESERVGVGPGQLNIYVHPDITLCVTTASYLRRPPIETKGWDHVVEFGHQTVSGEIAIADAMGGTPLPNLAARGAGHYRIRVHYDLVPGKGDDWGAQRLLIMSYPGRSEKVVVHR